MNDQILNKDITIASAELKGPAFNITDQDGVKYSFFLKKQDGADTQAYSQYLDMNLNIGKTVSIGYTEKPASFIGREGTEINFTRRNIINFRETNAVPVATPQAPKQYSKPNGIKKEEPDWNAIAVGKTASLFLEALISSGKTLEEVEKQIPQAYALAEKVVNFSEPQAVIHIEEVPIPREHELYGAPTVTESDIPF